MAVKLVSPGKKFQPKKVMCCKYIFTIFGIRFEIKEGLL